MTGETLSVRATIAAPAEAVFAVLADPTRHPDIDGTGWLRGSGDPPISGTGQVFAMAMYHDNHPDKNYEMANLVTVFEVPTAIAWEPGSTAPTVHWPAAAGCGDTTCTRWASPGRR